MHPQSRHCYCIDVNHSLGYTAAGGQWGESLQKIVVGGVNQVVSPGQWATCGMKCKSVVVGSVARRQVEGQEPSFVTQLKMWWDITLSINVI